MLWWFLGVALAGPSGEYIEPPWLMNDIPEDPAELIGQVWDVRGGHWVSPMQMMFELRHTPYVVLGEDHYNPSHHAFETELVQTIGGARRMVAFQRPDHVDIMDAAFHTGSGIVRAIPPGDLEPTVMDHGDDMFLDVNDLMPLEGLDDDARARLEQALYDAACGEVSEGALAEQTEQQILEDAWMARTLIRHGPTILVADTLHARSDVGVARYVDDRSVTVLLRAVDDREDVLFTESSDFIWFTPSGKRRRPCR